jgi:hypothetical protein
MYRRFLCVIFSGSIFFCFSFCQDTQLRQKANDAFRELGEQKLTLRFINALDGSGIAHADVNFEEGGNFKTDTEGKVQFTPPMENGQLNVSFKAKGYVSSSFTIEIMAGTLFFNRLSVSPTLPGGSIRIVLDWDKEPVDLDAHLVKEGSYHISYRDMKASSDGFAKLDHDAMNGYGPETITLNSLDSDGKYEFYVHDFSDKNKSNSTGLSRSKATVKIFGSSGLQKIYKATTDNIGVTWKVFRIEHGEIMDVNEFSNVGS